MRLRRPSQRLLALAVLGILAGCADGNAEPNPPADPPSEPPVQPPPDPPPPPPPADGLALGLARVADGLAFPLHLTAPPGDPRLFVLEKGGRIRVLRDGTILPAPFLDVSAAVSDGFEQGLLGLAFHPQYATNGRFFVHFTNTAGDTRLVAYRVSAADPDVADPATADTLLRVEQPFANHNGGMIAFGPDGMLYMALGDGGSGGDPQGNGQDGGDLLGSLLRLDVSGPSGYAVPADNPFVGRGGVRPELWDLGLRNPWRFAFDRETGDLYIADVGQGDREEIDVAPATGGRNAGRGRNYGWDLMEGRRCFESCDTTGLTLPVLDYDHSGGACSVTGGYVYRGQAIPALRGTYFYADYCAGWVRSFRWSGGAVTEPREWAALAPGGAVPSFGEDAAGELYVLDAGGAVYRIVQR